MVKRIGQTTIQYLRYGICVWKLEWNEGNHQYPFVWVMKKWIVFPHWLVHLNRWLKIPTEKQIEKGGGE